PARGVSRPAGRDEGAGSGDDERDEQGSFTTRIRNGPGLLTPRDRSIRRALEQVGFRKPPKWREDQMNLADVAAGRQGILEPAPCLGWDAVTHGDQPDQV